MTASVRISAKSARQLEQLAYRIEIEQRGLIDPAMEPAIAELRRGLAPKPKSSAVLKTASKKRKKGAETKEIRAAVWKRANGACECRCGRMGDELDHYPGRIRVRQSVASCWLLSAECHRAKTLGRPDSLTWHRLFLTHAKDHGYMAMADYAQRRIDAETSVQAAEMLGGAA